MKTRSRNVLFGIKAFTLAEVLIAMVTTVITVGAALAVYLYCLKMHQFTRPKLEASDQARKALALLIDDIRSAHKVNLGIRTNGTFQDLPPFSTQVASALRIFPSTNTNQVVIYYWDKNDETVRRATNDNAGTIIASGVTNEIVFAAEDYRGAKYTNQNVSMVIGVTLRFNQIQYPKMSVGPGNYYDYYQVRAKINKRAYL